jgi:hypothetical protein
MWIPTGIYWFESACTFGLRGVVEFTMESLEITPPYWLTGLVGTIPCRVERETCLCRYRSLALPKLCFGVVNSDNAIVFQSRVRPNAYPSKEMACLQC